MPNITTNHAITYTNNMNNIYDNFPIPKGARFKVFA